jgi:hypothetical protein
MLRRIDWNAARGGEEEEEEEEDPDKPPKLPNYCHLVWQVRLPRNASARSFHGGHQQAMVPAFMHVLPACLPAALIIMRPTMLANGECMLVKVSVDLPYRTDSCGQPSYPFCCLSPLRPAPAGGGEGATLSQVLQRDGAQ